MRDPLADRAYRAALAKTIRPGATVLDLAGGSGGFAVLACRLGAARVYSAHDPEAGALVRRVVRANNCEERVTVVERASDLGAEIHRVDVIVARRDLSCPPIGAELWSLARAPVTIPFRERLRGAVVECPDHYARHVAPWRAQPALDLTAARDLAVNTVSSAALRPSHLIAPPLSLGDIHYGRDRRLEAATVEWRVSREAVGHGIAVWSVAELADGVQFSGGPAEGGGVRQIFLPWAEPVALRAGDVVRATLGADGFHGDGPPWWRWSVTTAHFDMPSRVARRFDHSSFMGAFVLPHTLSVSPERAETGRE